MPHSSPANSYHIETVKICGITSADDRDLVADAGADYFGVLVDVGYSPRSLTLDQAKPLFGSPPIPGIVSLANPSVDRVMTLVRRLEPHAIQLLGKESPEFVAFLKSALDCQVWKSLHVPAKNYGTFDVESMNDLAEEYEDSGADAILLTTVDSSNGPAKFGTGMAADWGAVRGLAAGRGIPVLLGGGLHADNILSALQTVRPAGVDVCSGVESSPGRKDPVKLRSFFETLSPFRSNGR
jgi:phosphoribosylanthranilate isomerase